MGGEKENILVSACLLGVNCRYDGGNGRQEGLIGLIEKYNFIPVCPEQLGGLETPREPAEQLVKSVTDGHNEIRVVDRSGKDVTDSFFKGAEETLKLARLYGCKRAILMERSPSCGHGCIYDGTFSGTKVPGDGVTARLLEENGIHVSGESRIGSL
ncbi:MAG TPA: purine-nucleoside phosphorylase [Lachnoclostridium sp.]|nr:purine-nucleoside phosphorylase [Lachnoclostridium sp.]